MATKTITLTDEERRAFDRLRWYAHCDTAKGENSYGEYLAKLKAWTDNLREKHNLGEKDSFAFK